MPMLRRTPVESNNPQLPKKDIITEMFEHFEIEVVDATPRNLKPSKRKAIKSKL